MKKRLRIRIHVANLLALALLLGGPAQAAFAAEDGLSTEDAGAGAELAPEALSAERASEGEEAAEDVPDEGDEAKLPDGASGGEEEQAPDAQVSASDILNEVVTVTVPTNPAEEDNGVVEVTVPTTSAAEDASGGPTYDPVTGEIKEGAAADTGAEEEAEEEIPGAEEEASDDASLYIVMVDPNPVEASAAGGESEGNGSLKLRTVIYQKPENVISMIVPITAPHTYDFVLDPQGLLAEVDGNVVIGAGSTVFFRHAGEENTYSILSDFATAVNKSTVPVEMTVELQLQNGTDADIHFTGIAETGEGEDRNLGFAIVPAVETVMVGNELPPSLYPDKAAMVSVDADGFAVKEYVLPAMTDNYEVVELPTDVEDYYILTYQELEDAEWPVVGYALYGVCNQNADWRPLAESLNDGGSLSLQITYHMEPVIPEEEEALEDE